MNSEFNNIALFIKRAEEFQTKEFIIDAFALNNIGKVNDVKFIKKYSDVGKGKNYNGVIVIFERWNTNNLVKKLFKEMSSSHDGTTKFFFNNNQYWIINVHKQKLPECKETIIVDSSLTDTEKISKMEEIIKSMSTQIYYMQIKQEQHEQIIMDYECKYMNDQMVNMELRCQIEEKEREKAKKEMHEEFQTAFEKDKQDIDNI